MLGYWRSISLAASAPFRLSDSPSAAFTGSNPRHTSPCAFSLWKTEKKPSILSPCRWASRTLPQPILFSHSRATDAITNCEKTRREVVVVWGVAGEAERMWDEGEAGRVALWDSAMIFAHSNVSRKAARDAVLKAYSPLPSRHSKTLCSTSSGIWFSALAAPSAGAALLVSKSESSSHPPALKAPATTLPSSLASSAGELARSLQGSCSACLALRLHCRLSRTRERPTALADRAPTPMKSSCLRSALVHAVVLAM
mmetsp:Transcript_6408/g.15482  ORF Transcript_6408/g.15482 Transcript_6408/m.15482 type:complete len:255 (+) Transcript_6408:782-1546(+)